MARKLLIALVILAALAGGAFFFVRAQLSADSPAPPELARVVDPTSQRRLLSGGEVVGYTGRYGSQVWLGIPYAEPPVGERRWRASAPPAAWSGTREALAFGAHCPQIASLFGGASDVPLGSISGSEDCLFLNVYAPRMDAAAAAQARLPVMVWIHGGGNTIGLSDFFDGGRLAQEQNLMVVTLNYRLGPLGWLRHAALREGATPAEQSGNFTTLDLIRALEWLRENAAGFGGDPGNVTIFGESAGGHHVFMLLLSPLASGLFQRAIAQSGGTGMATFAEAENFVDAAEPGDINSSNEVLARLLTADGKASDAASARQVLASMSAAQVAGFLRSRTPEQLLAAYQGENEEGMFEMPQVFADGVVLPAEDPLSLLARPDGWNRVPVIAGTTRDEHKLFMFMDPLYVRGCWDYCLGPRTRSVPGGWRRRAARLWKATGADDPGGRDLEDAPNSVRVPLRLGRGGEPARRRRRKLRGRRARSRDSLPLRHWDLGSWERDLRRRESSRTRGSLGPDDVVLGELRSQRRSRARRSRRAAGLERVGRPAAGTQVHDPGYRGRRRPAHGLGAGDGGERARLRGGRPAAHLAARALPRLSRAGALGRRGLPRAAVSDGRAPGMRRVSVRRISLGMTPAVRRPRPPAPADAGWFPRSRRRRGCRPGSRSAGSRSSERSARARRRARARTGAGCRARAAVSMITSSSPAISERHEKAQPCLSPAT